jgi:protein-S-isoprenylcysteine O-methyltransferase Ste14
MSTTYLILAVLCLSGLIIRTGYELLKQAGRVNPRSKSVFAVVFMGMCLVLLSWPVLGLFVPVPFHLPAAVHWAGLLVLVTGLGLAVGGVIQLRGLENIDHLVVSGMFAKLRHPMYTGFMLWILGWIIYYGATLSVVPGGIAIVSILYWRRIEEQKLEVQFGEDYHRYKKGTWF